jgi:CHAT domain-containing protein
MLTSGLASVKTSYAQAIARFESSRDLFQQLGDTTEAAIAENLAVQFLPDVARVAEGRSRLLAMIATAERRKFNVLLPPAYYWLGKSYFQQNRISEANKNFKTALREAEASKNTFEVQHAREILAESYSQVGELGPALFYGSKLLPDDNLYYQTRSQFLRDKSTLAELMLKLKFFSTSLSLASENLSIAKEIEGARVDDYLRGMTLTASANNDLPAALSYAEDAKTIALERAESPENTGTIAEIHLMLADIKSKGRDCPAALADYDTALALYGRIPQVTDSLYQIHKGRLFCFEQLNRQEEFSSELKTVLNLSEEYRATIREDSTRQAFFANEQVVFDTATDNAVKAGDSQRAFNFVEESKARSLLDFVESGKSIAEVEKNFGPVAQPMELPEIQDRLPEQVQLLQYAVLPDRLAIWIVSRTRFELVVRPITATDLEKKIANYQDLIIKNKSAPEIKQAGQELYLLLVPNISAGSDQICLVPDKSLHQLSFATLVSPAGSYLLQEHALFYAPSASVMVLASADARRKQQVVSERLLSIGNPEFDREENPDLPDLRAAEVEAKNIARRYVNPIEFMGKDATREGFLQSLTNVDVIHFAGHFVANRLSPANSKLLLADGDVRSAELSSYRLPRAKLVVLSACETGFERYNQSEGAIGIARTLLAMGTPLVVASQWPVDSEPTKDLMIAFHRNRKEKGMSTGESLRQAQLELLSKVETKAPFYWASFSLFGGYANY